MWRRPDETDVPFLERYHSEVEQLSKPQFDSWLRGFHGEDAGTPGVLLRGIALQKSGYLHGAAALLLSVCGAPRASRVARVWALVHWGKVLFADEQYKSAIVTWRIAQRWFQRLSVPTELLSLLESQIAWREAVGFARLGELRNADHAFERHRAGALAGIGHGQAGAGMHAAAIRRLLAGAVDDAFEAAEEAARLWSHGDYTRPKSLCFARAVHLCVSAKAGVSGTELAARRFAVNALLLHHGLGARAEGLCGFGFEEVQRLRLPSPAESHRVRQRAEEVLTCWGANDVIKSASNMASGASRVRIFDFGVNQMRIFVGSSMEGLPVARAIQAELRHEFTVTVWSQGSTFGVGSVVIERLLTSVREYDFGVFVFTPDDELARRGTTIHVARDNVVFELGLFMGVLGRERAFVVVGRGASPACALPSDLGGLVPATYDVDRMKSAPYEIGEAVGPACQQIRIAVHRAGVAAKR